MSDKSPDADDQSLIVNQLIAEFLSRRKSGEKISIEEFVATHPEHADELKHQLTTSDAAEVPKTTGMADVDETIIGSGDAIDQTVSRATSGSDTSVTQDFRQRNTGSATSIEISETFGRYTIQKVLGQGAMGAVYLAKDTQLDRDVALKIPKFGDGNGVDDKELLERFYREARASATIRSLNICPVYDVGEIDGQHYITMAFIEGRPLKDYTQSKKSHSEKQIITTIRKLASGLAEAHKIGVVHRDLKPANIMVDLKGEPVVMDFGLARRSASDDVQVTQSGAIVGTPAYMSPEQIEGDQSLIGPQTDIYALGVIMYELITGKMPFNGSLLTLISQIAANKPEKPSEIRKDLDPRLETICLKMMASDLSQRYQSMTEVANDLQNVLRNSGKQQKQDPAQKTGKKPTSIPSANEESNPALISIEQPKPYAEQLLEKKRKRSKKSKSTSKTQSGSSSSSPPKKKMLILGGVGGVLLLLGIFFLVRVGKYNVQITLDDPSITLSVDGEVLNIKDGQDIYQLSAGEHELQLKKEGLKTHVEEFTVSKDGKTALRAVVVNGMLDGLLNGEQLITPDLVENDKEDHTQPNAKNSQQYGLLFDSKESRVEVGDLSVDLNKPITIELWCYPSDVHSPDSQVSNVALSLGPFQLHRVLFTDKDEFLWQFLTEPKFGSQTVLGAVTYLCNDNPLKSSQLHNIVVQLNGTQVQFFLNGKPVELFESSWGQDGKSQEEMFKEIVAAYPDLKMVIGSGSELNREFFESHFNGVIRQLSISNELKYVGPFVPKEPHKIIPDENTVALYRFDEGSGDTLKDLSSNGHDGKIIGAKWVSVNNFSGAKQGESNAPLPAIAPFGEAKAKQHQQAWAKYLGVPVEKKILLTDGQEMVFMLIPPGEFMMGSTREEQDRFRDGIEDSPWAESWLRSESPRHRVRITRPFYLGKFEVTNAQWLSLGGKAAAGSDNKPTHPLIGVKWVDIQKQIKEAQSIAPTDTAFSLPTEAQWEYACRAGTTTVWHFGDDEERLKDYAWYEDNSKLHLHPVGKLLPNAFGLHDMLGNAIEHCLDPMKIDFYAMSPVDDPEAPNDNETSVQRGGSRRMTPALARSATRFSQSRRGIRGGSGFRLVLSIDTAKVSFKSTSLTPAVAPFGKAKAKSKTSMTKVVSGKHALQFANANDVVTLANKGTALSGPLTVEMWLASATPPISKALRRHLASIGIEQGLIHLDFRYNLKNKAETSLISGISGPSNTWTTGTILESEYAQHGWMHVACIWTGQEIQIYLNGKRRWGRQNPGDDMKDRLPETVLATLGGSSWSNPFQGRIRELRISKSIRYPKNFELTSPDVPFVADANTVALYHFDEGSGDVLKDSSGNGHDGKIVGAKWVSVNDASRAKTNGKSRPGNLRLTNFLTTPETKWSQPVNLGAVVNSEKLELRPTLTRDLLTMYFGSDRDGTEYIYIAKRSSVDDDFGPPVRVQDKGITGNYQSGPFLFADDLKMAYTVRAGGKPHIWIASRKSLDQPFRTRETTGIIGSWPTLSNDGLTMIYKTESRPQYLIEVTRSAVEDKFSQPKELVVNATEPFLFPDGLTLIYGRKAENMRYVTRTSRKEPFGNPTQIGAPFTKGTYNGAPFVTADRKVIYFISRRRDGVGDADLYRSNLVPK